MSRELRLCIIVDKKMKKLFITIAFVAAAMFAQAQFYLGGSIGFDYYKNPTTGIYAGADKVMSISVLPNVGYMFSDKMGVGVEFGLSYDKAEFTSLSDIKTTIFQFSPYFRYVFGEIRDFSFYADAKLDFGFGKYNDDSATVIGVGILPGVAYNLTDNVAIVGSLNIFRLGFDITKHGDTDHTHFGLGVNENTPLNVGLVYNF